MKVYLWILIGLEVAGAVYAYQKILGGKTIDLPVDKYIVGGKNTTTPIPIKQQELVAVSYSENIAKGIDEVVKRTGNLDFIKAGDKVLIKPNVNSDDPAPGTTHPEAVAEVVRLVKAKGAYVIVGDRSNPNWNTISAMETTGMYEAVMKAGADEIVGFDDEEWIRVTPANAKFWPKGFRIPKRLQEIDHLISVPVLHTHSLTGYSLGIKNLVGLINPLDRMLFHASKNMTAMIAEISLAIKPDLTIIDGTRAFIKGGPGDGELAETKVYLASKDVLATDVVGTAILKKFGASFGWGKPWESDLIKNYWDLGISQYSQKEIDQEVTKI